MDKYFAKVGNKFICRQCRKNYSVSATGSTTSRRRHLRAEHPDLLVEYDDKKRRRTRIDDRAESTTHDDDVVAASLVAAAAASCSEVDEGAKLVAEFVAAHDLPLDIVDSEEFKRLYHYNSKSVDPPSSSQLASDVIPLLAAAARSQPPPVIPVEELFSLPSGASDNEAFLAITNMIGNFLRATQKPNIEDDLAAIKEGLLHQREQSRSESTGEDVLQHDIVPGEQVVDE